LAARQGWYVLIEAASQVVGGLEDALTAMLAEAHERGLIEDAAIAASISPRSSTPPPDAPASCLGVGPKPKFSLVGSVSACKTWCFAVFGWGLLGYASLSSRSSNARFWSSVGVVSCW